MTKWAHTHQCSADVANSLICFFFSAGHWCGGKILWIRMDVISVSVGYQLGSPEPSFYMCALSIIINTPRTVIKVKEAVLASYIFLQLKSPSHLYQIPPLVLHLPFAFHFLLLILTL